MTAGRSTARQSGGPADVQDCPLVEQMIEAGRVPARHRNMLRRLTPMEMACLRLLGWGRSNADIGLVLVIAENTVRVHLSNAARKLDVDGMRELAALAGMLFYPLD